MSDEILTGRAAELAAGGFTEMPDPRKKEAEQTYDTPRDALSDNPPAKSESTVVREYLEDTPYNESPTVELAAHHLSEIRRAEAEDAEKEAIAKTREEVDADRPVEAKPAEAKPQTEEINLEKALNLPEVRQAIEQRVGEAEATRQSYLNNIEAATQLAQHAFISQFPEFANTTPEQQQAIAAKMMTENPERLAALHSAVVNSSALFEQQKAAHQAAQEAARREFKAYGAEQDAKFAHLMAGVPVATANAARQEILEGAKAEGLDPAEFVEMVRTDKKLRSATMQRIIFEAGAYRAAQKAAKSMRPAPKPIPPSQRPGVSAPAVNRGQPDVRALSAKLSDTGSLKDAAALLRAQRAGRK